MIRKRPAKSRKPVKWTRRNRPAMTCLTMRRTRRRHPANPSARTCLFQSAAESDYKVFSTKDDEEIKAEELCDDAELERLRAFLDKQLAHLQGVVGRLANRMQRRLMAQQNRAGISISKKAISTRRASRGS